MRPRQPPQKLKVKKLYYIFSTCEWSILLRFWINGFRVAAHQYYCDFGRMVFVSASGLYNCDFSYFFSHFPQLKFPWIKFSAHKNYAKPQLCNKIEITRDKFHSFLKKICPRKKFPCRENFLISAREKKINPRKKTKSVQMETSDCPRKFDKKVREKNIFDQWKKNKKMLLCTFHFSGKKILDYRH